MDKEKVLDRLRTSCSRREYCTSDVRKKAQKALEGDSAAADEIVGALVDDKYVDDLRYASAFARDKSSIAGWGMVKIRYMLSSKGIPSDTIEAALGEIDGGKAADKLERMVEIKAKSLKGDPQARVKLLRFAMGRGYSYDDVNEIISRHSGPDPEYD